MPDLLGKISTSLITTATFLITFSTAFSQSVYDVTGGMVSVSSLGVSDGVASIFLDVRLKDGWQTYHKSSENYDTHLKLLWPENLEEKVSSYEIDWPPFIRRDYYGEQIEVYNNQVLLPVSVTFEDYDDSVPDTLEFELEIFFCSNVCMKENLQISLPL